MKAPFLRCRGGGILLIAVECYTHALEVVLQNLPSWAAAAARLT